MAEALANLGAAGWFILIIAIGSPVVGTIIQKKLKPTTSPLDMLQELQEERAEDKKERDALKAEVAGVKHRERIRDDYIHQLRQHIADGNPPPPPPWPKELTQ